MNRFFASAILIGLAIFNPAPSHAELTEAYCEAGLKTGDNLRPIFENWKQTVGARLKDLMTGKMGPFVKRITHEEMAKALGVSTGHMTHVTLGKAFLTKAQVEILANLLQVHADTIFEIANSDENQSLWSVKDKQALNRYYKWASEAPGQNQLSLALDAEVSQASLSKFFNGLGQLRSGKAQLLADILSLDPKEVFDEHLLYKVRSKEFSKALVDPRLGRFKVYSQEDINLISGIPRPSYHAF